MRKINKNKRIYKSMIKKSALEKQQNGGRLIKKSTGITLLALCITIIVILILASIVIGTLSRRQWNTK